MTPLDRHPIARSPRVFSPYYGKTKKFPANRDLDPPDYELYPESVITSLSRYVSPCCPPPLPRRDISISDSSFETVPQTDIFNQKPICLEESPVVLTRPASCATTVASSVGPIFTTRRGLSALPSSPGTHQSRRWRSRWRWRWRWKRRPNDDDDEMKRERWERWGDRGRRAHESETKRDGGHSANMMMTAPSVVLPTPRALCSRRSALRPSSLTPYVHPDPDFDELDSDSILQYQITQTYVNTRLTFATIGYPQVCPCPAHQERQEGHCFRYDNPSPSLESFDDERLSCWKPSASEWQMC